MKLKVIFFSFLMIVVLLITSYVFMLNKINSIQNRVIQESNSLKLILNEGDLNESYEKIEQYNQLVMEYNILIRYFPSNLVARYNGHSEYEYFIKNSNESFPVQ